MIIEIYFQNANTNNSVRIFCAESIADKYKLGHGQVIDTAIVSTPVLFFSLDIHKKYVKYYLYVLRTYLPASASILPSVTYFWDILSARGRNIVLANFSSALSA